MIISFEEKHVLQKENLESLENLHSKLLELLRQKSQEYQRQFPFIDSSFRINLEYLYKNRLFDPKIISQDLQIISEQEEKFISQQKSLEERINTLKGGIIEIVKTIFQEIFFSNKFIIFRSSKFDDYFNGIDQILFSEDTLTPVAAIDITTNVYYKNPQNILRKLQQGASVKYLPVMTKKENSFTAERFQSQTNVPMLYLIFDAENIMKLANFLVENNNEKIIKLVEIIKQNLRETLINEINNVLNLPITEEKRQIYETLLKILVSI